MEAMTRSRKSREYGFGIGPPESNQRGQTRSLTTPWESSRFKTSGKCSNLTGVIGLETCQHYGPSIIDHRTLQRSKSLPLSFLRGMGLPERMIDYQPSLFDQAIQYYSCFISYTSNDRTLPIASGKLPSPLTC